MNMGRVSALRDAALAAEKAGRPGEATAHFDTALALSPDDARLLNSAGGSAMRLGDLARAEKLYTRAHALVPGEVEFAVNRAIVLGRLGRAREAVAMLQGLEGTGGRDPRYWSTRGSSAREAGDLRAAAASYDRCLALDPGHARALHGRARVALEQGEGDASARYARAIQAVPGDASLWLGRAMALEAEGDVAQARQIAGQLSAQMPGWIDAHRYLAELRLNTEPDALSGGRFADHYAAAAAKLPSSPEVATAWCSALAGADCFAEVRAVAEAALARMPGERGVHLAAAVASSAVRDFERADTLFAGLADKDAKAYVEEARHRLRCKDPEGADSVLARALEEDPRNVSGWGVRSLAWRMLGDPREEWLHGQEGLVRQLPLPIADADWARIGALLTRLHDESFVPVGQSVRGGSQTRGSLFARREDPLRILHEAIMQVIGQYQRELPAFDAAHPLLSRRAERMAITGSWSVRLGPGGRHTVHIHPQGVLSSALYVSLPSFEGDAPGAGVLEVGGAPPEMELDLPPRALIPPRERHLTLFPSTLFHGTRPFAQGTRMTVAFDVTASAD